MTDTNKNYKISEKNKSQKSENVLFSFLKLISEDRIPFIISIITNIISTILFVSIPLIIATIIDDILEIMSNNIIADKWSAIQSTILFPSILIVIIALINFTLNYYQEYQMAKIGETAALSLRKKLSYKLTKLPLNFYDTTQVGEILSKASSDIDKISEVIVTGFNQFINSFLTILLGVTILFFININMAFTVIIVLIIGVFITTAISIINQKYFQKNMTTLSSLSNIAEETFSGDLVVKAFGKENDFIHKMNHAIDVQYNANKLSQFFNYSIYPSIRFINQIAFILSAFVGGHLAIRGILTVGLFQAFLQYVVQISEPISNASYIYNSLQGALASMKRIQNVLDLDEEINYQNQQDIKTDPKGKITFNNVSFGYSKETLLMKNVSFEANPEQMIAIVGPTGAGKTTLINLLLHFYEINDGEILFDDVNINDIPRQELRKNFGMVLQDTWLFHGSVADNISYGKSDATREQIVAAAKIAQCDNIIRKLPDGYDTIISSEDSVLSQGEQQLITIARAILSDPTVMILDEATSSIDTKTEKSIQTAIKHVMKNRTSFVIAHRLSTIKNADLILVMKNGNIVEKGTHNQLLDKKGIYANLYETQFN